VTTCSRFRGTRRPPGRAFRGVIEKTALKYRGGAQNPHRQGYRIGRRRGSTARSSSPTGGRSPAGPSGRRGSLGSPWWWGYSDCDALSLHVKLADEAVPTSAPPPRRRATSTSRRCCARRSIPAATPSSRGTASSREPDFADAAQREALVFIGPSSRVMRILATDRRAQALAASGVPVTPAIEDVEDADQVIKFPTGSGGRSSSGVRRRGGKGDAETRFPYEWRRGWPPRAPWPRRRSQGNRLRRENSSRGAATSSSSSSRTGSARDPPGERECSIQRRHQKLVEEAPSSLLTPEVRARMGAVVVKAMKDIGYETAGTLEFLVDKNGKFYALEVNTRIQVEHTVTEMITGFDIIRKMYKIAAGDRLSLRQQDVLLRGHAIQCRINAEDPKNGFAPSFGRITFLRQISGPFIRTESGIYQGWESRRSTTPCSRRYAPWGRTGGRRSSGCGAPCGSTTSGASGRRSRCCGGSWTSRLRGRKNPHRVHRREHRGLDRIRRGRGGDLQGGPLRRRGLRPGRNVHSG